MRNPITTLGRRAQFVAGSTLAATALVGGAAYAANTPGDPAVSNPSASAASAVSAAPVAKAHLRLRTSTPELAACFPHARARVHVDLATDEVGKDRFKIRARGLQRNTDFTVFLIEKAGAPFGAVEYIGDFTTDRQGRASNTFDLIVEEAFAFNNETRDRTDLNSVGFWFADEKADDKCLGAGSPVTGFDGDAAAGVQMMNSGVHLLP